jgi:hypothetical protein
MRPGQAVSKTDLASAAADLTHGEALDVVRKALGEIQYGSILITIHQGEVAGIETSTKVRLRRTN